MQRDLGYRAAAGRARHRGTRRRFDLVSGRGMANVVLSSLGIGRSWSFVSRRRSGQMDTDVVE